MMLKRLIIMGVVGLMLAVVPYGIGNQRAYQEVLGLIQSQTYEDAQSSGWLTIDTSSPTLPSEIGQLQNLYRLEITSSQLSQLPSEIGQLQNLQELVISAPFLTALPPEIGQLQSLRWLDITSSELSQLPPEIGQLQNLQELIISAPLLTVLPPELAQLQNLYRLEITASELSQLPPEIGQLQNLQVLTITASQLSAVPPEIGQLQKLQTLQINASELSQLPPEIGQLQNLQTLRINASELSQLPPEIGQLQKLTYLNINANQLSQLPPEIGQLENLYELAITTSELSQLPPEIGQLQNLELLRIMSSELSQLPPEIGQLQNLTSLYVSASQLSQLPPEIGQLQNLTHLNISSSQLSQLPLELWQLQKLDSLEIRSSQLSQLPPEIGQLQNLTRLEINASQLSALPAEIGQLQNLRELYIDASQIRALPPEIGQLQKLVYIRITSSQLTSLPPEIVQLQNLISLVITSSKMNAVPPEIAQQINVSLTPPTPVELTFPNIYGVWGLGLLVGIALFVRRWQCPRPTPLAISLDNTKEDRKAKLGNRLPIYRWRVIATLVASLVCSIPLFTYIAHNSYPYGIQSISRDENILWVMGACYLIAWIITLIATRQVSHTLRAKWRIEAEQPLLHEFSVWKATAQTTFFWHVWLVIPRYGLAYGLTQMFFTHFDWGCRTFSYVRIFIRPYCYSYLDITFTPSWHSALVALAVLILLAVAECGLSSAIACVSTSWKGNLLRRGVWGCLVIGLIVFYAVYGFKDELLRRYDNNDWSSSYDWVIYDNFQHFPEHMNGWFDTHIVGMSLVDNGILLAANIMRDTTQLYNPYQDNHPYWIGHHIFLGVVSSGVFALITAYYLVYLRKPIVLREEHTS